MSELADALLDLRIAPETRRLCVCADDFGLHAAVNDAVLRLIGLGRLQATGAMVGAPGWNEGAKALSRLDAAQVDVGLHLDLTQYPLTLSPRGLAFWLLNGPRLMHALHREVHAQLDAFEQAMGRMPAYVDGHQHVHQFPGIRDALLTVLAARYPGHHPWLRSTRAAGGGLKPRIIDALGRRGLEHQAESLDFSLNHRLLGVYGFDTDTEGYQRQLDHWLSTAQDGDLLMCHPAAGLVPEDAIAHARCHEFLVWSAPDLGRRLSMLGLQLAPMSQLLKQRQTPEAVAVQG